MNLDLAPSPDVKGALLAMSVIAVGCTPAAPKESPRPADSAESSPDRSPATRVAIAVRAKYKNPRSLAIAVPVTFTSADGSRAQTLDLELDTGSSGITLFASPVADLALERIGGPKTKTYGGGDVFEGQLAKVVVSVGGVATTGPILIRLVDRVHCAAGTPHCHAESGSEEYLRAQGFDGILGVGLRQPPPDEPYSPFAQMPPELSTVYVVAARSRLLLLGPKADSGGFARFALERTAVKLPNGAPAFDDRDVPVCLSIEGTDIQGACGRALLDSGSWSTLLAGLKLPETVVNDGFLVEGTPGSALVGGVARWAWKAPQRRIAVPERGMLDGLDRVLGMPFFEDNDVLFDRSSGNIGVRAAP